MIQRPESLAAAVREFRELTARDGDAGATRARVLAQAVLRRRVRWGRLGLPAALVAIGSAALAATGTVLRRSPAPIVLTSALGSTGLTNDRAPRPRRTIPLEQAPAAAVAPVSADSEPSLYGAAHAAHFGGTPPDRALTAWDRYLQAYPHGRFEPEARFNRAICLIRLQRFTEAAAGLAPFADGRFQGYRRAEAARLLDWMATRDH